MESGTSTLMHAPIRQIFWHSEHLPNDIQIQGRTQDFSTRGGSKAYMPKKVPNIQFSCVRPCTNVYKLRKFSILIKLKYIPWFLVSYTETIRVGRSDKIYFFNALFIIQGCTLEGSPPAFKNHKKLVPTFFETSVSKVGPDFLP